MLGIIPKQGNLSLAKKLSHFAANKIIEELRLHVQDCYSGVDRSQFWKDVKKHIDDAYKDY